MDVSAITLNIENWQLIIAIIIMLTGLFGQPFLVREMNRTKLEKKADKCQMDEVEKELRKKANIQYVDTHLNELKSEVKDNRNDANIQLANIDSKVTKILTILIEKKI